TVTFLPLDGQFHGGTVTVNSDGGTVAINVQGQANAAPSIQPVGDKTVAAFTTLSFTVVATDADDTRDDEIAYSMISDLPPGPPSNRRPASSRGVPPMPMQAATRPRSPHRTAASRQPRRRS